MSIAYNKRSHFCGDLRGTNVGETVRLAGWMHSNRNHGGLVFVDLRDHTGLVQLQFNADRHPEAHKTASSLHFEDVIAIEGTVISRGSQVKSKLATGEIEIEVRAIDLLSRAAPLPFPINDDFEANEDRCLESRFLHFRRPEVQKMFRLRHRVGRAIREYFHDNNFVEVETPFLTKSTPEGARDYLVPSRVREGAFYALPQSPQIFKQLLMIGGFDRYAQIVRCFRDEDLRADRQPEFTQLDMEMAFVQADDVMAHVEACVQRIFKDALDMEVTAPFPRMGEKEAMERFGIDRPDTRFGVELQDVTELAGKSGFRIFEESIKASGVVKCLVAPGAASQTRKVFDGLTEELKGIGAGGMPYVKVNQGDDGVEFATGIAKFIQPMCTEFCEAVAAKPGDVILFAAGSFADASKYLHYLRTRLADILDLIPEGLWNLLWVVDFPLVVWDEEEKRWNSTHHPFTAPLDADLPKLETDPGSVRAKAYDLVLNGTEMAGGSIRIHQQEVQQKVFGLLGIGPEEAEAKFKFLLDALRYGAPPHGGIAFGFDRWIMSLSGSDSLREVIAFPKTTRAVCPLTDAPGTVSTAQLDELNLAIKKAPKS